MTTIDSDSATRSSHRAQPLGGTTHLTEGSALVILRWHPESAFAWMTVGQGPTSRFLGFVRLADPSTLAERVEALGWRLLAVRQRPHGLAEAEILIPVPTARQEARTGVAAAG